MRNILFCLLTILLSLNGFSQSSGTERAESHYVFIVDRTYSMVGKAKINGVSTPDIWEDVCASIKTTVNGFDLDQGVISVYVFAEDVRLLSDSNGDFNKIAITEQNKTRIYNALGWNGTKWDRQIYQNQTPPVTGMQTCTKAAFKSVIDKVDDNIGEYFTQVFVYSDSHEDCDVETSCEDAFSDWCALKSNKDLAQIILFGEQTNFEWTSCAPENCITRTSSASPKTYITIQNDATLQLASNKKQYQVLNTKSVNLKQLGLDINDIQKVDVTLNMECMSLENNNVHPLDHEVAINTTCNLEAGKVLRGTLTYPNRVIYSDDKLEISLQFNQVDVIYTNREKPMIHFEFKSK